MVNLTIDGKSVQANEEMTLLWAARMTGAKIPTLCYMGVNNCIGSCRVCVVDVEGAGMVASCNTVVREGMVVHTDTAAVVQARRQNVGALMDEHRTACASCVRQESCALRRLASDFNVLEDAAEGGSLIPKPGEWNPAFPLQRDASKCIKCLRCVAECQKVQHCAVWDFTGMGPNYKVVVKEGLRIEDAGCALCGQCITHCPTGALTARDDTDKVMKALIDPQVETVVQVAPAVRAAWGEDAGLSREEANPGRLASALRALGFDHVYDTDFAADLTIMEEGSEFIEFLSSDKPRPMFTSCCPGWVRFVKQHYPEFVKQLSSAKSPHEMLGAVSKHLLRDEAEAAGRRLFTVSVMPCVAKKYECDVPQLSSEGAANVDAVLTVREFVRMLKMFQVDCAALEESPFDNPLGQSTGAGTIFGRTGGVMEAALRTAATILTGERASFEACDCTAATPNRPWMSKELDVAGTTVNIAVASGLGNTARLLDAIKAGEAHYDFVEIMACPGGCVGGGGQPIAFNEELGPERAKTLNSLDANDTLRMSHDNPSIKKLYDEVFERPLSRLSHELLHTSQEEWDID